MAEKTVDRSGTELAHLFVVHSDEDEPWVSGFLLPRLGLPPSGVITADSFPGGSILVEEYERAVLAARVTVLVLSPTFAAARWPTFAQLLAVDRSVRTDSARLVPLLLHPYHLPPHLDVRKVLDCTDVSRAEKAVAALRALLDRPDPPTEDLPCPYPGLQPFTAEQTSLFFGRRTETERICHLLSLHELLVVIGSSGCGKSSLVAAGVIPRLLRTEGDSWAVRAIRGDAQTLRVVSALLGVSAPDLDAVRGLPDGVLHAGVAALLGDGPPGRRLLLVVDQAEAVMALPSPGDRRALVELLDRLRQLPECVLLLVLAASFYGHLLDSPLRPGHGQQVEIVTLTGQALREALVEPAATQGVRFEPVLLDRLVRDAADGPNSLPMVQETMSYLWPRRTGRLLTAASYDALAGPGRNGIAVAMAERADAALNSLSPADQAVARRILVRLVQLGEGREDMRRPQPVSALRGADDDPAALSSVLHHLTTHRLVTVRAGTATTPSERAEQPEGIVDLGHESLITSWGTLAHWIEESRRQETLRRRVERDAADWDSRGRYRDDLYARRRLADALDWMGASDAAPSTLARQFLAAGRRRRSMARAGIAAMLAAAVAGVGWLTVAPVREWWLRHEAVAASPVVRLPAGTAIVGTGRRHQFFPALGVERHEVSNRQYRYCVEAGRCPEPVEPADDAPFSHGDRDLPVVHVTARAAADFCGWIGRRLPTEAEWERAARGTDGRRYPWGAADALPDQVNAIVGKQHPDGPVPVGSARFVTGRTPEGIEHLMGNVSELTATAVRWDAAEDVVIPVGTWNGRDPVQNLAVMGGGWGAEVPEQGAVYADNGDPVQPDRDIGFRCVTNSP